MKVLTLKLRDEEMLAVGDMAQRKGLTKTGLVRQALRVFQAIEDRLERGDKVFIEDENKDKAELLLL